jgi:hypothetical protein
MNSTEMQKRQDGKNRMYWLMHLFLYGTPEELSAARQRLYGNGFIK